MGNCSYSHNIWWKRRSRMNDIQTRNASLEARNNDEALKASGEGRTALMESGSRREGPVASAGEGGRRGGSRVSARARMKQRVSAVLRVFVAITLCMGVSLPDSSALAEIANTVRTQGAVVPGNLGDIASQPNDQNEGAQTPADGGTAEGDSSDEVIAHAMESVREGVKEFVEDGEDGAASATGAASANDAAAAAEGASAATPTADSQAEDIAVNGGAADQETAGEAAPAQNAATEASGSSQGVDASQGAETSAADGMEGSATAGSATDGSVTADAATAGAMPESSASEAEEADSQAAQSADAAVSSAAGSASSSSASNQAAKRTTRTLKAEIESAEGEKYVVSIEVPDNAGIPQDATLSVTEILQTPKDFDENAPEFEGRPLETERFATAKSMAQRAEKAWKALDIQDEDHVFLQRYFDVCIQSAGKTLQPKAPVEVTVEASEVPAAQSGCIAFAFIDGKDEKKFTAPEVEVASGDDRDDKAFEDGAKLRFETQRLGEMALYGVAQLRDEFQMGGFSLKLYGPAAADDEADEADATDAIDVRTQAAPADVAGLAEGAQVVEAVEVQADPDPDYGTSLWLEATPVEGANQGAAENGATAQTSASPDAAPAAENTNRADAQAAALAGYQVTDGELAGRLFTAKGTTQPVEIAAGEGIAIVSEPATAIASNNNAAEAEDNENKSASTASESAAANATSQAAQAEPTNADGAVTAAAITDKNASENPVAPATSLPAKSLEGSITASDGHSYNVSVTYGESAAIPQGATLKVRELAGAEYATAYTRTESVLNAQGSAVQSMRAFDIAIFDADGNEVQPANPVDVKIRLSGAPAQGEPAVVHLGERGTEVFAQDASGTAGAAPAGIANAANAATAPAKDLAVDSRALSQTLSFEATGFSVYAVAYTVDFHWGGYTYNLEGGSTIFLSELLETLINGVSGGGSADGYDIAKLKRVLDDPALVEDVEFSDPKLIEVLKSYVVGEDDAAEQDEEDDEALAGAEGEAKADWALVSKNPFDTAETLTITLTDGSKIEIPTTDERMVSGITAGSGGRVTVDGVTYTLQQYSFDGNYVKTNSEAYGDNTAYYGRATVYALSSGCTIHDEILYGGRLYKVWNLKMTAAALQGTTNKMDRELVNRAAGYKFGLPYIRTSIQDIIDDPKATDAEKALAQSLSTGYTPGAKNDEALNKVWKKAEYDESTNSIKYTMQTFQSMKEDEKLDFIFIYDDSITMYTGDRGAPRNNANDNRDETVIREAQATRIMVLSAAQALTSSADKYDIRVAMGGASNNDNRKSKWFSAKNNLNGGYSGIEDYLATYKTGATSHLIGLNNALALAQESVRDNRQPIVIYLSDFKDGAYNAATANELKKIARVYTLQTADRTTPYPRAATITTDPDTTFFNMSEIDEGVKNLEKIILDAIGYYMKDKVEITDAMPEALAGATPGEFAVSNYTDKSGEAVAAGTSNGTAGSETWTIGETSPYIGAGNIYTQTFTVPLDEETIYAGSMPTNGTATVEVNGEETNTITPDPNDPDALHLARSVTFVLGQLDKNGNRLTTGSKGEPDPKINLVPFTLYEAVKDDDKSTATNTVYKDGAERYSISPTGEGGSFVIPFKDGNGNVLLELGHTYLLKEGSVANYNATCKALTDTDYLSKPQLIQPDAEWVISVGNDGVVKVSVNGAAGQTPESNKWKGLPPKVTLWNQIVVPATLIPITVKKTWPDSTHPHEPVQFSIYAINPQTGERIEKLTAYDGPNAATAKKVQYIDSADRTAQEWSQTVYVLDKVEVEGQTIELFHEQTIGSQVLADNPDNTFKIGDTVITQDNWNTYADPTDHLIHYGQTWSYDIVEESNLVYPYGWYTPSYPNNASATAKSDGKYRNEAALAANSLQGWTKEGAAGYSWESYSGNTSTDFYMAIDMHGFHFKDGTAADKTAFKNFFGLTNNTYSIGGVAGATASNGKESPLFFNRLDTFEVTIKDRKTSKYYQVTSKVSGEYDAKDSFSHADVLYQGVMLPAIWVNYEDDVDHGQQNLSSGPNYSSRTDLEVIRITAHCVNGADGTASYDLVLYSKAENISADGTTYVVTPSSSNVMDWGPQKSSNNTWTTGIIRVSDSTVRNDRVYSSVVNSPAQQLMVYTHHAATDPEMVSSLTYASFQQPTLSINNAWNNNTLTEVTVNKNWKNNDNGTAVDYSTDSYNAKPDSVNFTLKGKTDGALLPIFTSEEADWYTGDNAGNTTGSLSGNKNEAAWTDEFWVPSYDMDSYSRSYNASTRTEEESIDKFTFTKADTDLTDAEKNAIKANIDESKIAVGTDDDGKPKGEWAEVEKAFSASEYKAGYDRTADFYPYTPEETQNASFYFTLQKADAGWSTTVKQINNIGKIRYTYTVGEKTYRDTIYLNSSTSFENSDTRNYKTFEVNFPLPANISNGTITKLEMATMTGTKFTEFSENSTSIYTYGVSTPNSNNESVNYKSVTYEEYLNAEHVEPVNKPSTFTLTNTYTPYKELALTSTFTDGSEDKASTGNISKVVYTINGTTQAGESYNRTVTTAYDLAGSKPTVSTSETTLTLNTGKTVYVPKGTYTINQTAYTLGTDSKQYGTSAFKTTYTLNSGTATEGSALNDHTFGPSNDHTALVFTNNRKTFPIQIKMDWEPGLESGEDPLNAGGKALDYTISYDKEGDEGKPVQVTLSNGNYTVTGTANAGNKTDEDFNLTYARQVNGHAHGIPTYSVREMRTECVLDSDSMEEALPEYGLSVDTSEEKISGTDTLVFTINANIKRAPVVIEKNFDEAFDYDDYKGAELTYTLKRSDGKKIYGTGTDSVELTMTVPTQFDLDNDGTKETDLTSTLLSTLSEEDQTAVKNILNSMLTGTILLHDENTATYDSGLDARTKEVYTNDGVLDTINLPILRATDVDGGQRVKYVVSETVKDKNGVSQSYFPSFTDQTNNSANAFEQINPAGKNIDTTGETPSFGKANTAKFILNPAGIIIGIGNAETPYICKIVEVFGTGENKSEVENPFRTLNAALDFARKYGDGTAMSADHAVKIQMLVDYQIPSDDKVELKTGTVTVNGTSISYTDNIIITTAATSGGIYNFTPTFDSTQGRSDEDSDEIAILQRGWNGTSTGNTALFYLNNASAKLSTENITLDGAYNTVSQYKGRAVYVNSGDVCFAGGTTVRNFHTAAAGGAVYVNNDGNHTLIDNSSDGNVVFSNCGNEISSSNDDGAAICIQKGNLIINNSGAGTVLFEKIVGNKDADGGAIGVNSPGSITLNNTSAGTIRFVDCTACYGGAMETDSGNITLNNSGTGHMEFVRCYVDHGYPGGAIYCGGKFSAVNNGTITFTGTIGTDAEANTKTTKGGAIYANSSASDACSITGSGKTSFTNCKANGDGGAIYAGGGVTINQTGGTSLTNCIATGSGGGIYSNNGTADITNASFTSCSSGATASGSSYPGGGGIYSKKLNVSDSTFTDCTATKAWGGAINGYASNGVMHTITNCTFDGHDSLDKDTVNAKYGGAVGIVDGSLTMTGCNFYDLTVSETGGAVNMGGGGSDSLSLENCTFDGHVSLNTDVKNAKNGGAIRINADNGTTFKNVAISDCWTSGDGGGIYAEDKITSTEGTISITDCYTTGGKGGGAYFNAATAFGKTGTTGNKVTFTRCHDDSTSTSYGGGGAYFANTLTMQEDTNLSFDSCHAGSYGGGAWFNVATTLNSGTVSFKGCHAGKRGGGAYFVKAVTLGNDVTFEKCYTTGTSDGGGGAYFAEALTLNDGKTLSFKECYTAANGGGTYFNAAETNTNLKGSLSFEKCYSTDGKGGGAYFANTSDLSDATAVTFKECHANSDSTTNGGGGAYFYKTATLDEATNFEDCYTGGYGGAMYFAEGGTLTGVNVDGHKTIDSVTNNAAKGGAIYLPNSKTLTIVGGEFKNCSASDDVGGAVNAGGKSAVLNFEGAVKIYDNKSTKDGSEALANVVLDVDDNDLIKTTATGLTAGAHIGVYVVDAQEDAHGGINDPFGTWTATNGKNNLDRFTNDKNDKLFGMKHGDSDAKIYWGAIICKIEDSNAAGGDKLDGRDVYEHPFPSINAAVDYARANLSGAATIEMLIDYEFPAFDVVNLTGNTDDITITTAATTGCVYNFEPTTEENKGRILSGDDADDADRAILLRSWNGSTTATASLFYVNNASAKFTTTNIIFDGSQTVNTTFTGRAVYVNAGEATINDGSTFRNFSTADNGGAVWAANITVSGTETNPVVFENCKATGSNKCGGAIYSGGAATLTKVTFGKANTADSGCSATDKGGCVYISSGAATLTDCSFYYGKAGANTNASVAQGGGVCYYGSNELKILGGVFDHCSNETTSGSPGYGTGGAVYVDKQATKLTVDQSAARRSSFTDCSAHRFGGAIHWEKDGGTVEINNADFTNCHSKIRGGGAVFADSTDTTIDACSFSGCYSESTDAGYGGGGAIFTNADNTTASSTITISGTTFSDCTVKKNGGAVQFNSEGTSATLTNVSIDGKKDRTTTDANAELGAAIYSKGDLAIKQTGSGTSEIKNCSASTATNGGAVNVASGKTMTFEGNVVVYDNKGTGALADQQKNVVLDQDNNTTINTTGNGLGATAHVGVYVTGNESTNPYKDHGEAGMPFGTMDNREKQSENLKKFTNDKNGLKGCFSTTSEGDLLIYWKADGIDLQLLGQEKRNATAAEQVKLAGATFELRNAENQLIWIGRTGADGIVQITYARNETPLTNAELPALETADDGTITNLRTSSGGAKFDVDATYTLTQTATADGHVRPGGTWTLKKTKNEAGTEVFEVSAVQAADDAATEDVDEGKVNRTLAADMPTKPAADDEDADYLYRVPLYNDETPTVHLYYQDASTPNDIEHTLVNFENTEIYRDLVLPDAGGRTTPDKVLVSWAESTDGKTGLVCLVGEGYTVYTKGTGDQPDPINLYGQWIEPPELVPLTIKKSWDADLDWRSADSFYRKQLEANRDIPFTVYGVTASGQRIALHSFTAEDGITEVPKLDASEAIQQLVSGEDATLSQKVYVLHSATSGGDFASYEIEEHDHDSSAACDLEVVSNDEASGEWAVIDQSYREDVTTYDKVTFTNEEELERLGYRFYDNLNYAGKSKVNLDITMQPNVDILNIRSLTLEYTVSYRGKLYTFRTASVFERDKALDNRNVNNTNLKHVYQLRLLTVGGNYRPTLTRMWIDNGHGDVEYDIKDGRYFKNVVINGSGGIIVEGRNDLDVRASGVVNTFTVQNKSGRELNFTNTFNKIDRSVTVAKHWDTDDPSNYKVDYELYHVTKPADSWGRTGDNVEMPAGLTIDDEWPLDKYRVKVNGDDTRLQIPQGSVQRFFKYVHDGQTDWYFIQRENINLSSSESEKPDQLVPNYLVKYTGRVWGVGDLVDANNSQDNTQRKLENTSAGDMFYHDGNYYVVRNGGTLDDVMKRDSADSDEWYFSGRIGDQFYRVNATSNEGNNGGYTGDVTVKYTSQDEAESLMSNLIADGYTVERFTGQGTAEIAANATPDENGLYLLGAGEGENTIVEGEGKNWVQHFYGLPQGVYYAVEKDVRDMGQATEGNPRGESIFDGFAVTYDYAQDDGQDAQTVVITNGPSGSRRVILRKIDDSYNSLVDRQFAIYKGSASQAYTPKGEANALSGLTASGTYGCFWAGVLPYGTYVIEEAEPNRWFYLIVDETGTYGTLFTDTDGEEKDVVGGYATRAEAESAAKAKSDALKAAKA